MQKDLLYKTLIAQSIGDSFGYKIEFDSWESIQKKYGETGFQFKENNLNYLSISDDTQMTLFLLNGLIEYKQPKNESIFSDIIYNQFRDWLKTQTESIEHHKQKYSSLLKFECLYKRQAPGITCLSALNSGKKGTITRKINDSKGCGSIMRTLPIAFFANNENEVFELSIEQSMITHGNLEGAFATAFYSLLCFDLIYFSNDLVKSVQKVRDLLNIKLNEKFLEINYQINNTLGLIIEQPNLLNDNITKELGEGWTSDSALCVALFSAATSASFKEVIEKSSNHSGDSDSTAMLATGLWFLSNKNKEVEFIHLKNKLDAIEAINFLVDKI